MQAHVSTHSYVFIDWAFKKHYHGHNPVLYGAPKDTQSKYHIVSLAGYACAPYDAIFSNNLVLLAPLRLCVRK